ncbi:AAA family ATPase [Kribbella sp. NPDC059898]|uniref:AAA family ATPase n=1 Tax=Kribbella sp. NPDC059898 TaxID=3346995 RepID=UPI003651F41D
MTDERPLFLRELRPQHEPRQQLNGHTAAPGTATAYALRALSSELDKLEHTPEGGRNHQLNVSAFNLAQLVLAGHLGYESTWASLAAAAHSIGLSSHETQATLQSAFRAASPRDVPEQAETTVTVVTAPDSDDVAARSVRDQLPRLDWHELWADDSQEEWIVEPILPARRHVAMYSAPKVGKSLLMLELAVAIARGEPVLGTKIDRPRRVLYLDYENDPRADVRTRLVAMGRGPDDLEYLDYLSFPQLGGLDTGPGAALLLAACNEYGTEVVVIDTVSRAVAGEENENDTWLGLYRRTGLALKQAGIACIRLDHTGKDPTKGMRGGSAKYGDVDAVWSMTTVSDTTFRLECTANRMPITEKVLVVRREMLPHLRHEVEGGGVLAVATARKHQLIEQLNELYGDRTPPSIKDAMRRLKDRFGISPRFENVRDAINDRELTFNRLPWGEDQ